MVNKYKEAIKKRKKLDKEWSINIKKLYGNKCAFCDKTKYIQAHHIIPREVKKFKYLLINGIALCPSHHKWGLESAHKNPLWFFIKFNKKYKSQLKLLIKKYRDMKND